jgi:hypothetical protein
MSSATPAGDRDPRAPFVDEATFALVAELEIRQAVRLQYYVSLLTLDADIHGPAPPLPGRTLSGPIAELIRDQIRGSDVVSAVPESSQLQVLLVSTHVHSLPAVIERIAAAVGGHAFEADGRTWRVTLSIGGACFPTTARTRPELFRQAESLSAAARREASQGHRYRLAQAES